MYDSITSTLVIAAIVLLRFLDNADELVINVVRGVSALLTAVHIIVCIGMLVKVTLRAEKSSFQIPADELSSASPIDALQNVFLGGGSNSTKTVTIQEYDTAKIIQRVVLTVAAAVIAALVHLQFGTLYLPLSVALAALSRLGQSNEFRLHVLAHNPNTKELKRPWKREPLNPIQVFKELKKQVQREMAGNEANPKMSRDNKKFENRKRMGK